MAAKRVADMTRGEKVISFIETFCVVPEGPKIGKPFKLDPFEKRFILAVYDNPHGTLRAYLSIARKNGKALALTTRIPTPHGWTTMGALRIGDKVLGASGEPTRVVYKSPVYVHHQCYRIMFDDGTSIDSDAEHLWAASRGRDRQVRIWTTQEMFDTPKCASQARYRLALCRPLELPEQDLPLPPYVLGYWLGNGSAASASISFAYYDQEHVAGEMERELDLELAERVYAGRTCCTLRLSDGVRNRCDSTKVQSKLRMLGVLNNKHIPQQYLRGSLAQRWALLQGLMDSDGSADIGRGIPRCVYVSVHAPLADGVAELARSLGLKVTRHSRPGTFKGVEYAVAHSVTFNAYADQPVFRSLRKQERLLPRPARPARSSFKYVRSIEPIAGVPTQCIKVDAPDELYLAGDGFTVTHNTSLIACLVLAHVCGPEAKWNTQIVSGARSRDQAALTFDTCEKMLAMSPQMRAICHITPSTKKLRGLTRNALYMAISAEGKTALGKSPILVLLDEVGQVRGPNDPFFSALETSQGAHDNPLLIAISTQAANDADLFSVWIDDAKASKDPHIVCHLYETPIDAALDDEDAWKLSNPALGKFRNMKEMRQAAKRAKRMPSFEPEFRNLYLNQRVELFNPFVSRGVWVLNSKDVDQEAFYKAHVFGGFDLSSRTDLTALVLVAFYQKRWHVKATFWTPEKGLRERAKAARTPLDVWAKQGLIRVVPGAAVDYEIVAKQAVELMEGMDIKSIAFDRWRFDLMRKELDEIGAGTLPLVPFGQGFKDMSPALDLVEVALMNEQIAHGGNAPLTMCAMNSRVERDAAGNRKLSKAKATGFIDGMVALVMAMGAANGVLEPPKEFQAFFL